VKKLFENWNNYLNERGNPSESRFREAVVDFIVGQMKTMGMNPGEPKDRDRIQKETHNIVDLAIEQLGLAQERASLNEVSVIKEDMGREILIPGYGSLTVDQARRKLARLIMAAAEDAQKDPPVFRYLDDGVIQAIHQALKDNKEQ
tara:strand:+ start:384 stop:821 length:438 start_codon:yes stop_codon:yes gene_type:complete